MNLHLSAAIANRNRPIGRAEFQTAADAGYVDRPILRLEIEAAVLRGMYDEIQLPVRVVRNRRGSREAPGGASHGDAADRSLGGVPVIRGRNLAGLYLIIGTIPRAHANGASSGRILDLENRR